jgi:hypothetical protein
MRIRLSEIRRAIREAIRGPKILILVHPDAAIELPRPQAEEYYSKIRSIYPGKYDKIFTNFMFSTAFKTADWGWHDHPNWDIFMGIREHLEIISDHAHDVKMGKERFEGAIGNYLLDHSGVTIHFGGGYQDLCLRQSYDNFCSILGWLRDGNSHRVVIARDLVFHRPDHTDDEWMGYV